MGTFLRKKRPPTFVGGLENKVRSIKKRNQQLSAVLQLGPVYLG